MIVEAALIGLLVVALIAALMVSIFRAPNVVVAAATSAPATASPTPTVDSPPTPAPTVTVYVDAAPSSAVRITHFFIGPIPADCSDPGNPPPLTMQWTSVNGSKASLTMNSVMIAQNLPPSGDEGDLPASAQPFVYGCQSPYEVFKLTVSHGASSATQTLTAVATH